MNCVRRLGFDSVTERRHLRQRCGISRIKISVYLTCELRTLSCSLACGRKWANTREKCEKARKKGWTKRFVADHFRLCPIACSTACGSTWEPGVFTRCAKRKRHIVNFVACGPPSSLSDPRKRSRSNNFKSSSQRELLVEKYLLASVIFFSTFIFTGIFIFIFIVQKPKRQEWPADVGEPFETMPHAPMRHFRCSHCCQVSLSTRPSTSAKTEAQVRKIIIKSREYCEPNEVCEPRAQIKIIRNTNKSNKGASC